MRTSGVWKNIDYINKFLEAICLQKDNQNDTIVHAADFISSYELASRTKILGIAPGIAYILDQKVGKVMEFAVHLINSVVWFMAT
jgi:hypothetical protein